MRENIFGSKETQVHPFISAKIPCLRQHKQAVTLHLDDRALGFPFLLKPSERSSCRKHHLLERKREGRGRTEGQGVRRAAATPGTWGRRSGGRAPSPAQPHSSAPQGSAWGSRPSGRSGASTQPSPAGPRRPLPGAPAAESPPEWLPVPRRHSRTTPRLPSAVLSPAAGRARTVLAPATGLRSCWGRRPVPGDCPPSHRAAPAPPASIAPDVGRDESR